MTPLLLAAGAGSLAAQQQSTTLAATGSSLHPFGLRTVPAARRPSEVTLDGRLDDPAWVAVVPAGDFRQAEPNEGQPATQRTEVRFLFDDDALWVGARMYDTAGGEGVRTRLVRRDRDADADQLELVFDTFHDHLGRTFIAVNPSGVKNDSYGPGGANPDPSWDPLYEVRTAIDSLGWTAEIRIPLGQLRYAPTPRQDWGLQIWRTASRVNEVSMWSFYPSTDNGGASRFGHLEGLELTRGPSRGEFLPYVVGRSANVPSGDPADPFHDPHEMDSRAGADLKYLMTSNLTLNATVNPDFGQVEVDPAVINLSAFETFFEEKRPFFVENAGLFRFGGLNCYFCSNVSGLSLFYSRRIGRQPQGSSLAWDEGEYADIPENTAILGAAKVTGRTPTGWSLGLLDATTRAESAPIQRPDGSRGEVEVEPFTNYFVGRVARDLRGGSTVVRGMLTSVLRDLGDDDLAARLPGHAETGGVELDHFWGNRAFRLMATAALSNVAGEAAAIDRLQRASARYFQRPDRESGSNGYFSDAYDPARTSLRGWATYARLSKETGNWQWELNSNVRSPGFESNDLGFLTRADYAWMGANLRRRWTRPGSFYRYLQFTGGAQQEFNFDGDLTMRQVHGSAYATLRNYWDVSGFVILRPEYLDDRLLRGGPVVARTRSLFASVAVSTNPRKPVVLSSEPEYGCNADGACDWRVGLDATFRPVSNVTLTIGPSYSHYGSSAEYVTAVDDPINPEFYGRRYVVSDLSWREVSMNTRVNWTFSPALSFELFLQPLLAGVDYSSFKEFARTRDDAKLVYGRDVGTIARVDTPDGGQYEVDPDGAGPAAAFTFADPDFNLQSLRGNAVLRWEFRPGSTVYFVWTQSRESQGPSGELDVGSDLRELRAARPDNIFMVKLSYWLGL
ncbi:MAG TPA: DUF5916 domain-containing protein [Gemmatimonadales bacterium]|nr:DUF5916 domain-containing protein [Gemmatimonadales bacterium]